MVTKKNVATFIRKAANVLEKYGWIKRSYGDESRGFCAIGSLGRVENPNDPLGRGPSSPAGLAAERYLASNCGCLQLYRWNDEVAKSKEQVIKFFRKAARDLEHGATL